MVISYALAADHPERVARLVVGEAPLPGVTDPRLPPLPLFLPGPAVPRLWHLTFNRLDGFNEQLVRGREDLFFGFIFDSEATIKLPGYAVRYYAAGFAASRAAAPRQLRVLPRVGRDDHAERTAPARFG
jgi:pimeloyl-ACP methyl ester carboxylesterase